MCFSIYVVVVWSIILSPYLILPYHITVSLAIVTTEEWGSGKWSEGSPETSSGGRAESEEVWRDSGGILRLYPLIVWLDSRLLLTTAKFIWTSDQALKLKLKSKYESDFALCCWTPTYSVRMIGRSTEFGAEGHPINSFERSMEFIAHRNFSSFHFYFHSSDLNRLRSTSAMESGGLRQT